MAKKVKTTGDTLTANLDLPHKRVPGWRWMQTCSNEKEFSKSRLVFYAQKLLDLGMSPGDIQCLLSDLYWDCYSECVANGTFEKLGKPSESGPRD